MNYITSNISFEKSILNNSLEALDVFSPLSFLDWYNQKTFTDINLNKIFDVYKQYIIAWGKKKNKSKKDSIDLIRDSYIQVLRDITLNFSTEEEKRYIINSNFNDPQDLDIILPFYIKKLKAICLFYIKQRELVKSAPLQHNLKGSTLGVKNLIKKVIYDAVDTDTLDVVSNNCTFPPITAVAQNLSIYVEELYDTYDRYYNVSNNSSYVDVSSASSIRNSLSSSNINSIDFKLYIDFKSSIIDAIKQYPFILNNFGTNNFTVNPILSGTEYHYLQNRDFIDYLNEGEESLKLNLYKKLAPKYLGNTFFYLSTNNTGTSYVSGVLFSIKPLSGAATLNLLNRQFPTTATVPSLSSLYASYELGKFFLPQHLGVLLHSTPNKKYYLDTNSLLPNSVYAFPDPDIIGNTSYNSEFDQNLSPFFYLINVTNSKISKSNQFAFGQVLSNNYSQLYYGYQSLSQDLNIDSTGLSRTVDNVQFWTGKFQEQWANPDIWPGLETQEALPLQKRQESLLINYGVMTDWSSDKFGNEFGLYKNVVPLFNPGSPPIDESNFPGSNTLYQEMTEIERKGIFDKNKTCGTLYFRDGLTNIVEPAVYSLSSIFFKYPTSVTAELSSKILKFNLYYDTFVIETENYVVIDSFNYSYDSFKIKSNDNVGTYFIKSNLIGNYLEKYANHFYSEDENYIYFAFLSLHPYLSSSNYRILYPKIYRTELTYIKPRLLYPSDDVNLAGVYSLSADLIDPPQIDIFKIEGISLSKTAKTDLFNLTYLAKNKNDIPFLVNEQFRRNEPYLQSYSPLLFKPFYFICDNNYANDICSFLVMYKGDISGLVGTHNFSTKTNYFSSKYVDVTNYAPPLTSALGPVLTGALLSNYNQGVSSIIVTDILPAITAIPELPYFTDYGFLLNGTGYLVLSSYVDNNLNLRSLISPPLKENTLTESQVDVYQIQKNNISSSPLLTGTVLFTVVSGLNNVEITNLSVPIVDAYLPPNQKFVSFFGKENLQSNTLYYGISGKGTENGISINFLPVLDKQLDSGTEISIYLYTEQVSLTTTREFYQKPQDNFIFSTCRSISTETMYLYNDGVTPCIINRIGKYYINFDWESYQVANIYLGCNTIPIKNLGQNLVWNYTSNDAKLLSSYNQAVTGYIQEIQLQTVEVSSYSLFNVLTGTILYNATNLQQSFIITNISNSISAITDLNYSVNLLAAYINSTEVRVVSTLQLTPTEIYCSIDRDELLNVNLFSGQNIQFRLFTFTKTLSGNVIAMVKRPIFPDTSVLSVEVLPPTANWDFAFCADTNSILSDIEIVKRGTGTGEVLADPICINCGNTCFGEFLNGTTVTLIASASYSSTFSRWETSEGTIPLVDYSFLVSNNKSITAVFDLQPYYTLSLYTPGPKVITVDGFIDCPNTCDHVYLNNTLVYISCVPPPSGYVFDGYLGSFCEGIPTNECLIRITQDASVSANFVRVYDREINISTFNSSITSSTLEFGRIRLITPTTDVSTPSSQKFIIVDRTPVTLSATPAPGYRFTGWTGSPCESTFHNVCEFNVDGNKNIVGNFDIGVYSITIVNSGGGIGRAFSDGYEIDCIKYQPTSNCYFEFLSGSTVVLSAYGLGSSTLKGLYGGPCGGTGITSCILDMTRNYVITAAYVPGALYTLTIEKPHSNCGTVISDPPGIYCGATCSEVFNDATIVKLYSPTTGTCMLSAYAGDIYAYTYTAGPGIIISPSTAVIRSSAGFAFYNRSLIIGTGGAPFGKGTGITVTPGDVYVEMTSNKTISAYFTP
jgi:hypothetical protein